jgi:hypothetical protein
MLWNQRVSVGVPNGRQLEPHREMAAAHRRAARTPDFRSGGTAGASVRARSNGVTIVTVPRGSTRDRQVLLQRTALARS